MRDIKITTHATNRRGSCPLCAAMFAYCDEHQAWRLAMLRPPCDTEVAQTKAPDFDPPVV